MKNKKIILAGGSGYIGQELVKYFGGDNEIIILSRSAKKEFTNENFNTRYIQWDAKTINDSWVRELEGADVLINLTGKSVNCRYHVKQKKEIIDSRVNATKVLGEAIRKCKNPPELWINAASATIYKNSLHTPNDENSTAISEWKKDNMPFNLIDVLRFKLKKINAKLFDKNPEQKIDQLNRDFSVYVCKKWEEAFFNEDVSCRKIALRITIVLGKGGAMVPMLNLCKFGFGGYHGNGRQMFSWIHMEDVSRMIDWFVENKNSNGIYNAAAPYPVTNKQFLKTLRHVTGNKIGIPAPALLLEAGAKIIGTETELLLKSRWVVPSKILRGGFQFKYETAEDAVKQIVSSLPRSAYHLI